MVDRYPGLKMVAQQSADFDRAKGLEVMESILQKNPDINAVFCGNDAMAMGAYQALVSAGKADKVKVFGFDGADDVVKLIAEKKIAATGMQFPKVMAQKAAEFADEYIKGKRDFPQKIPVKVELVTPENVSKYGDYGKKRSVGISSSYYFSCADRGQGGQRDEDGHRIVVERAKAMTWMFSCRWDWCSATRCATGRGCWIPVRFPTRRSSMTFPPG